MKTTAQIADEIIARMVAHAAKQGLSINDKLKMIAGNRGALYGRNEDEQVTGDELMKAYTRLSKLAR